MKKQRFDFIEDIIMYLYFSTFYFSPFHYRLILAKKNRDKVVTLYKT